MPVTDETIRSLKQGRPLMTAITLLLWASFALASFSYNREPGSVAIYWLLFVAAAAATLFNVMAVAAYPLLLSARTRELGAAIKSRGGEVNCHTLAEQYVREYQNARMHPFTGEEEGQLISLLVERFGVFEETAAEIVAANWPLHRSGLKYREGGDTAATRPDSTGQNPTTHHLQFEKEKWEEIPKRSRSSMPGEIGWLRCKKCGHEVLVPERGRSRVIAARLTMQKHVSSCDGGK